MLWAGSKARDLYVGTHAVALCDGANALAAASVEGLDVGLSWAQGRLAKSAYRGRLRVWLSGALCRPFLLPALPGIRSANETLRVASKLANERTGLQGACSVWLDTPRRGEERLAIATAQETHDRIQASVGNRWRIESIRPWWADVLRAALSRKDAPLALGVQDCDSLTILMGRASGFDVTTTISPVTDRVSADAAFARALLSADVEPGRELLGRLVLEERASSPSSGCALGKLVEFSR